MDTKRCSKCGEIKPVAEFYRKNEAKDGLQPACIQCHKEHGSAYYKANKDKIAAYNKSYYKANKSKMDASSRKYYKANKDKIDAYHKAYRKANRAKIAAYYRKYYAAKKDLRGQVVEKT